MYDEECACIQSGASVVYDTQVYQPAIFGGGDKDDSDDDWELTSGSRILSDSEPPSDSFTSSESESDESMVVSKAAKKIKTRAVSGGSSPSWTDISSSFIDYLTKVKLPV